MVLDEWYVECWVEDRLERSDRRIRRANSSWGKWEEDRQMALEVLMAEVRPGQPPG